MRSILVNLPSEYLGVPLFGVGWLLGVWCCIGLVLAVWLVRKHGLNGDTLNQLGMFALSGAALSLLPPYFGLVTEAGLPIRGYGVMLLVAVSASIAVCVRRARQMGQDPEMIFNCGTWLFVGGILGARVFYVVQKWDDQFHKATIGETIKAVLNVAQGGLVVYGSLLGGGVALYLFTRRHRLPWLPMCDLIAPGLVLGMALGRIGCFLNGCCYGGESTLPWAVTFPWNSPPFLEQVEDGQLPEHGILFGKRSKQPAVITQVESDSDAARQGLKPGDSVVAINDSRIDSVEEAQSALLQFDTPGQPISVWVRGETKPHSWLIAAPLPRSHRVHPAQLYSTIDALLLCGFLLAYSPFRRRDGELLALLMTIHPISRFLLEVIRNDEHSVFHTGLTISQNVSLLLLLSAALLWAYLLIRPARVTWGEHPVPAA